MGGTQVRINTNEGDQRIGTLWLEEHFCAKLLYITNIKGVGMKDQEATCLETSIMDMWQKLNILA